jgi:MtN3 and saliva related transmembrane protein
MIENMLATLATFLGVVSSFGGFAQAYKIHKNKSSKDVSLIFFGILTITQVVWLAYGYVLQNRPLIIVNSVALTANMTILILYFKYQKKKRK